MSVLVLKVYSFECDQNCGVVSADYVPLPSDRNPLRTARRDARKDGWTFRNGRDYCPRHKETP